MIYFELRQCMQRLSYAEKGELFDALLLYGETGRVPALSERLAVVWPLLQMKLDQDKKRYDTVVIRNAYARYVKKTLKEGRKKLSFEQWKVAEGICTWDDILNKSS